MSRHFGMISSEEQEEIRNSSVAIAGVGGIGAIASLLCAKVGFGRIRICDIDQYEVENIVEQLFANYETIGRHKNEVAKECLEEHSRSCRVEIATGGIYTQEDADELVAEADFVISGVDNPKPRLLLGRAANKRWIPYVISANIGWTVFHTIHMPGDYPYDQIYSMLPRLKRLDNGYIDLHDSQTMEMVDLDWNLYVVCLGGYLEAFTAKVLKNEVDYYSYMVSPANFIASFSVNELVKLIINHPNIVRAPDIFSFDLLNNREINIRTYFGIIAKMRETYIRKGVDASLEVYHEYFSNNNSEK